MHDTPAATVAGAAVADMDETWERLARPTVSPPGFDTAMTESLPEPARRWLTHVIAPDQPLTRAAIVSMRGQIRLGRWIGFRAVQVLSPPAGFIWAARAGWGPLWISGYDRYSDDTGEMRWRLFSRIPVMSATGSDIDRSAAGRVAVDALLVPTAWLQEAVTWRTAENGDTVVAEWHVDDQTLPVTLRVGPDGALRSLVMPRWAQPSGHAWGEFPFGGTLTDETDFDGIKLPRNIRAGYFYETDQWDSPAGEFFRAEVTDVKFL
ncbi:MAG: hypothetical protein J2P58_07205 [Acidimicrobiaceae bacterium]|nr:hypothetical protein [Acidimicrobiaceae bacterium]